MYDFLLQWKNQPKEKKKPLVIKGARQVVKTKIVKIFGEENYENIVYLDFRENTKIHKAFEGNYNIDEIILFLSACDPSF